MHFLNLEELVVFSKCLILQYFTKYFKNVKNINQETSRFYNVIYLQYFTILYKIITIMKFSNLNKIKRTLRNFKVRFILVWCRWRGSNPHEATFARFWVLCVCHSATPAYVANCTSFQLLPFVKSLTIRLFAPFSQKWQAFSGALIVLRFISTFAFVKSLTIRLFLRFSQKWQAFSGALIVLHFISTFV